MMMCRDKCDVSPSWRATMRRLRSSLPSGEDGFSVGVVLIFLFLMIIAALSVFTMGSQDAALAVHAVRESQALFVAESGIELGRGYLEALDAPPGGTDPIYPVGEDPITIGPGLVKVCIIPDPHNPYCEQKLYTVRSKSLVGAHTRQVEVVLSPDYYANYLYFTDKEHMPGNGGALWFITPDMVDGPMFTNDQISIMGDPTFLGAVFSSYGGPDDHVASHDPAFLYFNGDQHNHVELAASANAPYDNPNFMDGYVLGDCEIDYPAQQITGDLKDMAQDGGISVSGNYEIEFSRIDDVTGQPMYGYVSYRKPGKAWNDVEISSTNGVMYVNGGIGALSGIVDGEMTVATNGTVTITDDLVYRDSNANGPCPGCDDVLGIISGSDINVAYNEANCDDCVIHAAMLCLANSFRAENWNTGDPRGTLTVWGSIIQEFRGSVGTAYWDGENYIILTGYEKDYHYDYRLLDDLPPAFYEFLANGRYARESWSEIPMACWEEEIVPLE
jgi:hypothetical protein